MGFKRKYPVQKIRPQSTGISGMGQTDSFVDLMRFPTPNLKTAWQWLSTYFESKTIYIKISESELNSFNFIMLNSIHYVKVENIFSIELYHIEKINGLPNISFLPTTLMVIPTESAVGRQLRATSNVWMYTLVSIACGLP